MKNAPEDEKLRLKKLELFILAIFEIVSNVTTKVLSVLREAVVSIID